MQLPHSLCDLCDKPAQVHVLWERNEEKPDGPRANGVVCNDCAREHNAGIVDTWTPEQWKACGGE